jgi:hypothetical protein
MGAPIKPQARIIFIAVRKSPTRPLLLVCSVIFLAMRKKTTKQETYRSELEQLSLGNRIKFLGVID